MSVIDRVKELLTVAEKPCAECAQAVRRDTAIERCGHQVYAELKLKSLAIPTSQALVESQKYIEDQDCQNRRDYGGDFCIEWPKSNREDWCDRCVALRLDGLAKVMER